jgi:hypothetical protein
MVKYKAKVSGNWGFINADRDDEIEFEMPDDATPEQVEDRAAELAFEWACEYLDVGAYDIEKLPQQEGRNYEK